MHEADLIVKWSIERIAVGLNFMVFRRRLVNSVLVLCVGFVFLRIFLSIEANSLWLDEVASMSLAYIPADAPTRWSHLLPMGTIRWLALLSSAIDPHFPTIYVITRFGSELIYFDGISAEFFTRTPLVLTQFLVLGVAIWACLSDRRYGQGALVIAVAVLVLVTDAGWRQHSAEARMYGLMSATGIAILCLCYANRPILASWLGFGLALLHPFGAMFGLAPAVVTLFMLRRTTTARERLGVGIGFVVTCLAVCAWIILKFVLKSSSGFTAGGNSSDIFKVLAGLNVYAAGAAALLVAAGLFVFAKEESEERSAFLLYSAMLLSGAVFVALLIVLKPSTPPYTRYITWANAVLLFMAAVSALMLLRHALPTLLRAAEMPLTFAVLAAAVVTAWGASFGPPWGNSLRQAAQYVNAVAADDSVATHDSFEMFDMPRWFRAGYRCFRGGQSVAYLSPAVRARMPCQAGNDVTIPPDVRQVYVIREPIAWVGPRQIHLDAFDRTTTIPFGNASVDVYRRRE